MKIVFVFIVILFCSRLLKVFTYIVVVLTRKIEHN